MEKVKVYQLMDLIEDIKRVNAMIVLHSDNPSTFMLEQYKIKKEKLMGYLIDELVAPEVRSPKSFAIIKEIIEKFYPNASKEAQADNTHDELNEIQHALAV